MPPHAAAPRARHVLVTRPAAGADETAVLLRAHGFTPVAAPLLRVVPRPAPVGMPGRVAAVVLTSRNAVPAIPPGLRGRPVFAVGDATAQAARAAGCTAVRSADGNADDLARLVLGDADGPAPAGGRVLLLAGAGQGGPLAASLRAGGLRVVRRVAYGTRRVPRLPPAALGLIVGHDLHAVVFMSAATAAQFLRVLPPCAAAALPTVVAACISEPTAAVLRHLPWRGLRVSLKPNLVDTLALL